MSPFGKTRRDPRFACEPSLGTRAAPSLAVRAGSRRAALWVRIGIALALIGTLGGCGRLFKASCAKPDDYAAAAQNAPLKVPPGLTAPDTRAAMPIPALNEPERPRGPEDPCIDAPPRYAEPKPAPPPAA